MAEKMTKKEAQALLAEKKRQVQQLVKDIRQIAKDGNIEEFELKIDGNVAMHGGCYDGELEWSAAWQNSWC